MINQAEKIKKIIELSRQTGNTTWILESAIERPNCIIVSRNAEQAKNLEKTYFKLIFNSPWYKKLIWKFFGRKHPKFVSLDFSIRGYNVPVIFDNSSLV
jgi:hypothetical protein